MNDIELIRALNQIKKEFFTLKDLEKILPISQKSIYTIISRLTKKGVLQRVGKGIYSVFGKVVIPQEIAPVLYYPSYLSLNTVLAQKGIINQIPQETLLVTSRKTKRIRIGKTLAVYRQIKKELFFGWYLEKQIPVAYPEKALLDLIYFSFLGRAYLSLAELDLSSLDFKRWQKLKVHFPAGMQKMINQIEEKMR